MIRLHHLRAENFKVLREVGLVFPDAGSILVEGLNESGKSTLFESIYFALYGRPLISEGTIDSVVRYGTAEAQVELALSVDETELLIERQVRPGRPGRARLLIRRPGGYAEEVTRLSAIVERVVAELGGLDGETLLNSCFVEQKKLQRLESLDAGARRTALLRLLNLESLGQLESRFKLNRQDDQALRAAEARRDLAQLRARLPELAAEAARVERRLVARRVGETLARAAQLETAQAERRIHRLTLDRRQAEAESRLARLERLVSADAALAELLHIRERRQAEAKVVAGARAEVEQLRQLTEIELPRYQRRRAELDHLSGRLHRLETAEAAGEALTAGAEGGRLAALVIAEIASLEQRRAELTDQLERFITVREAARQTTALQERLDQHTALTAAASTAQAELTELCALRDERLPAARTRLTELFTVADELAAATAGREVAAAALTQARTVLAAEQALADAQAELATAEQALTELGAALERAGAGRRAAQAERSPALAPILAGWVDARAEVERTEQAERERDATTSTIDLQRARVTSARADVTAAGRRRVAAFALGLVGAASGAGLLAFSIFPLGLLPLLVAAVALLAGLSSARQLSRLRHNLAAQQRELDKTQQRALTLAGTIAAFGDGPRLRLAAASQRLTALGAPLPDDLAAGRAALEAAEQRDANSERALAREQQAELELARLQREQGAAERRQQAAASSEAERQTALNAAWTASGRPPAEHPASAVIATLIASRQQRLAAAEQRLRTTRTTAEALEPGASPERLREQAAALRSTVDTLEERAGTLPALRERLGDTETRAAELWTAILAEQSALVDRLERVGLADPAEPPSRPRLDLLQAQLTAQLAGFDEPAVQAAQAHLTAELGAARQRAAEHRAASDLAYRRAGASSAALRDDPAADRRERAAAEELVRLVQTGTSPDPRALADLLQNWRRQLEAAATALGAPLDPDDLRDARTRLATEREQAAARAGELPRLERDLAAASGRLAAQEADLTTGWAALAKQLATLDYTESYGDPADLRSALTAERRQLDELGTRAALAGLVEERGKTESDLAHLAADLATARATVADLLGGLDLVADPTDRAAVIAALPEVDQADLPAEAELDQQRDQLLAELGHLHREGERLEAAWGLAGVALDLDACQSELELAGRERAIKQRATTILTMARTSMVGRVLPTTEQNLRLLLPRLTDQRYHDATLSEDYRLEVWDAEAGRYVAKDIFSGGARDQFSLALRLAFALATLPQELGTTPGFIFLDEPLSAFDSPRTDALVDLLTTGQIARSFAQIFLISHSRTFDPALFPYYLRMQAGRVAETNLARL